ncbi:MAG: cytochrome b/b6 domain-containing protein [Rhizobiaceae bacterium]|nr:cytochrome b/b6 domain-containing protein [Rhizobiaceae bacterium]
MTETAPKPARGGLIYRQRLWTRLTHWIWAVALFFLLLSGLQIFNAHPTLYIGDQSGFGFDNSVLSMRAENTPDGPVGTTTIFGHRFDTTGVLGLSTYRDKPAARGFPSWATIPSYQDLGTGRVVHFFFAWILSITLIGWLLGSLLNGHLVRDLLPRLRDIRNLPRDIADHARLRFHHQRDYNTLQKLAYGGVLFVLLPLIIATGLAMSPTMNAALPWLPELLGGRQTARTIHFGVMLLLVGFFIIHILMIVAAGPLNELRSIVTGWYRTDPPQPTTSSGREGA